MPSNDNLTNALNGGFAGIISRTSIAPLELLKIYKQNDYLFKSTKFFNIIKTEGVLSLWKGNFTNCIRIFPNSAINFMVFNNSKKNIKNLNINIDEKILNLTSGIISGIAATTFTYPLDNARTRLIIQTNNSYYYNIFDVFKKTSIKHLYNGYKMTLCGFVPYNSLNFMFYNMYKKYNIVNNKNINNLISGGAAGISAVSITYPTDLIRRRLQLQDLHNIIKYSGIFDCIKKIYNVDGIKGFYKGLGYCYIKLFPAVAIQFCIVDYLTNLNKVDAVNENTETDRDLL